MNKIVIHEEWVESRKKLLKKEKEFTKLRDQLTKEIRELPWVKVEKEYKFHNKEKELSFANLFDGKSQLIIYHFMLGPGWKEGCKSCSFWADNFNQIVPHLRQRDVNLIAVSRAPIEEIESFKKRMGWSFAWVSSYQSDFNYDYHVSFRKDEEAEYNYRPLAAGPEREYPGISVYYRDENDQVYHTYSRYARGMDLFNTAYHYLDIAPKGRNEEGLPYGMAWVQWRDKYEDGDIHKHCH